MSEKEKSLAEIADILRTMPVDLSVPEMDVWLMEHVGDCTFGDVEKALTMLELDHAVAGTIQ